MEAAARQSHHRIALVSGGLGLGGSTTFLINFAGELVRRGIAADARVHVLVEVRDAEELSPAAIAQAGGAFDWLADEADLYSDADLIERAS